MHNGQYQLENRCLKLSPTGADAGMFSSSVMMIKVKKWTNYKLIRTIGRQTQMWTWRSSNGGNLQ